VRLLARKNAEFWESAYLNNRTYLQYYNRLTELAISMFEWKNLPETVDPRFLELTLFSEGKAVFFKDDALSEDKGEKGYLALQCSAIGSLDLYRIPMSRHAFASNGYSADLDNTNSVLIYNNYLHTNSLIDIEMYARRLYEIERTIDVNVKQQKTPLIVRCSETQRLVMKNLMAQYEGNEPFIFGDQNLDLKGIEVFPTVAPYVADKLNQLKREIFNEALTYLGISNVNIQKKERLLSDEVTRNMGSIEAQKYTRLNSRKEACAKINKMFGLSIDVEYREDIKMLEDDTDVESVVM
jgi:hypothetical protein